MNENNITVVAKTAEAQDIIGLDLLDLLAVLLLKWKRILAVVLIGAILGFGLAQMRGNSSSDTEKTVEEAIEEARGQLSEDKAVAVEQLFFQYVNYLELQKEMRSYYSSFAASDVSSENTVQMRSEYYITSSIRNLDTVFIKMAVTEADYQAMREIAPDQEAGAAIYNRISFTTVYNENSISRQNTVNLPIQEGEKNAYLINVELYGNSEEQCRKMMNVVEAAFKREAEELKRLDPEIELEALGIQFNYNVAGYVQKLRKQNIDNMTTAESEMNNLTNKVGKMSAEEKKYFELLQQQYEGTYTTAKHQVAWKRYIVIGAFLGAMISVGVVILRYMWDGKVKSAYELEQNGKLLSRVFIKGKKNLFGRWAAGLIHADDTDPAVKADMLATDVGILMEKNGKNAVMLLCSQEDSDAVGFAEQVKVRLQEKNGGLKVCIGNPAHSVDELEMAAQADMGVLFAEMKISRRSVLREWRQICERYKLPLAGSVAVQRCW